MEPKEETKTEKPKRSRTKKNQETVKLQPINNESLPATLPTPEKGKHITYDLRSPQDIGAFSKVLQRFIRDGGLSMKFKKSDKEEFVFCDGWKFAALNFGLTPRIESCDKISEGEIYHVFYKDVVEPYGTYTYEAVMAVSNIPDEIEELKLHKDFKRFKRIREITYQVKCSLVNISSGEIIGDGEAICSNLESKKVLFDQFAVMSMAQTRAISKACKNLLGFVMRAAGFAETPAEEMAEDYTHKEKPEPTPAPESIKNQSSKLNEADVEEIKHQLKLLNTPDEVNNYGMQQKPALQKNLVFRGLLMNRKKEISKEKEKQKETNTPAA